MLNGDSNENSKKSVGLISKRKNFAHAAHFFCTFLWCCFAQLHVQRETSYMSLHILYRKSGICSLFLFTATHFHLAGCYMYYFSFSHHQFSWFFLLLSTFTYACGSDGHAYGHIITKISRIHIEPNFGGAEEPEQWTDDRHLIFLHPSPCNSRSSLTKCHVRLVWLIKRQLCRLHTFFNHLWSPY